MLKIIDDLDVKEETILPLDVAKRATKKDADENLAKLRCEEETKWVQRAKVKHVQQGGTI
jgi:hypothetical protein